MLLIDLTSRIFNKKTELEINVKVSKDASIYQNTLELDF